MPHWAVYKERALIGFGETRKNAWQSNITGLAAVYWPASERVPLMLGGKMFIDAGFDGGNIDVVSISEGGEISLNIRRDAKADHAQWFYFRLLGAQEQSCKFSILNAGKASYPEAWPDGSVVASYDGSDWFRIATQFDGETLTFGHDYPSETLYVALSPPYPVSRHHDLICRALAS